MNKDELREKVQKIICTWPYTHGREDDDPEDHCFDNADEVLTLIKQDRKEFAREIIGIDDDVIATDHEISAFIRNSLRAEQRKVAGL